MGTIGLKKFALDMDQEVSTLGTLAVGGAMSPPMGMMPPAPQSAQPIAPQPPAMPNWQEIQAGIFAGESGGDYDALYQFSNRPGGRYSNVRLTDMTIDQALEFANPSGDYGQWVKQNNPKGVVSTPMGAYQVVGSTLRAAKTALGLRGDEKMTKDLQDRIGQWILKTQGTQAWEGYKGPGQPGVTMSAQNQPGFLPNGGERLPIDVEELQKLAEDMSPEAVRKRHQGAMLMALGQGLGQMSRGQPIDLSGVMEMYMERQNEARQRLMEIQMEARRQQEYNTNWDRQVTMQEMEETAQTRRDIQNREWEVSDRDKAIAHDFERMDYAHELTTALDKARRAETVEDRDLAMQHAFDLLAKKEEYDRLNAEPNAAEAEISRLMESYGIDREMAIRLQAGTIERVTNPVTGNTQFVDRGTQEILKELPSKVDYGNPPVDPTAEGRVPENPAASFGVGGALGTAANAVVDFLTGVTPAEQVSEANAYWANLDKNAMMLLATEGIGGRPAVWTQQQIKPMLPSEAAGVSGAMERTSAIIDALSKEVERIQTAFVDKPANWDTATMQEAVQRRDQLQSLLSEYEAASAKMQARVKKDRPPLDSFRR